MRIFRYLFLAAVLAGLYFLYQHYSATGLFKKETSTSTAVTEEGGPPAPQLLLSAREEITSFIITRKNLRAKFRKENGEWRIVSPVKGAVRDDFLSLLFRTLHELTLNSSFEVSSRDLKRYGLKKPYYELELKTTEVEKKRILRIGDTAPDGTSTYVNWGKKERVYLISEPLKPILKLPLSKMRSQAVFSNPPAPIIEIEKVWNGKTMKAVYKQDAWRMEKPLNEAIDAKKMSYFLSLLQNLGIAGFTDEGGFPKVSKKNYVKLKFQNGASWKIRIGDLDSGKGVYPVVFPEENLKVWVPKAEVEPLMQTLPEALYSRKFLHVPLEKLERVRIQVGDRKLFFIKKDEIWYQIKTRQMRSSFESLESLLMDLNKLEYLQKLSLNQKTALFFDISEVGLEVFFFRPGDRNHFLEVKCYLREDYNYLEINNSPPLYVLAPTSLNSIFEILAPLLTVQESGR